MLTGVWEMHPGAEGEREREKREDCEVSVNVTEYKMVANMRGFKMKRCREKKLLSVFKGDARKEREQIETNKIFS